MYFSLRKFCLGLATCCLAMSTSGLAQQEAMYASYPFSMLAINPAYAGHRNELTFTALYRRQWLGANFEGDPQTQLFAVEAPLANDRVALGAQLFNDVAGVIRSTGGYGVYAYKIPLTNNLRLSLGLQLGFTNFRADLQSVNTGSSDPNFASNLNKFLFSAGTGAFLSGENWYLGVSVPQIIRNKLGVFENPNATFGAFQNRYYFVTAGYVWEASELLKVKPSVVLKGVENAPMAADFNLQMWLSEKIGIGGMYRFTDSNFTEQTGQISLVGGWAGQLEVQLSPKFRLGYLFNQSIVGRTNMTYTSHEMMLNYRLAAGVKALRMKTLYY
jgi:type IX secretion system PorP/SprF family membrane protein